MADNILTTDRNSSNLDIAAKEIGAVKFPRNILVDPSGADIDPATEATLSALNAKVPASPAQDRATASSPSAARLSDGSSFYDARQTRQLTASDVVSIEGTVPVSFVQTGLTDAQLRASAVPVAVSNFPATQPVSFTWSGLTDAQLRATAVPVSVASIALPADASTETTLAAINAKVPSSPAQEHTTAGSPSSSRLTDGTSFYDARQIRALTPSDEVTIAGTVGVTGTFWQATQPVSLASIPALAAGSNVIGGVTQSGSWDVGVTGSVAVTGTFWQATQPVSFTWSGLTDAQLRAAPVPVVQDSPPFVRIGFSEVGSGLVGGAATQLSLLQTGSGMAVSQSGGNLVVTTGTTVNAETIIRSVSTFSGSLLARAKVILSQRIANQTFRLELADLVGEGLAYTINSATSVTVTWPTGTNPFTSVNVGQSLRLSRLSSVGIPGRYAIASVSGDSVTFTVAGFPGSGSGTLTVYGWNALWSEYSGTTATNVSFDAARRGWASGATTATINTTASPGHVGQLGFDVFTAGYGDALVASNTGYQWTNRASRIENIPDPDVPMYLFLVVQNGSTAPASTTTLTVGFIQVEDQPRSKIRVASSDPVGSHAMPVQVMGGLLGTQPVSGTVTATVTAGTVNPVVPATPFILNSAASTNGALILTGTSGLQAFYATNIGATVAFVKLYNKATAPTVGTDVPAMILVVPAAVSGVPGVCTLPIGFSGFRFALGLGIAITGAVADSDTTAVTAGQVKVILSRTV